MSRFGWQLVSLSCGSSSSSDELVAFVHWRLLAQRGLRVLGLGDVFDAQVDANSYEKVAKEALPKDWNASDVYNVKYVDKEGQKFVLKAMVAGNELIVTLINHDKEAKMVGKLGLIIAEEIDDNKQIRNVDQLADRIDEALNIGDSKGKMATPAMHVEAKSVLNSDKKEGEKKSRLVDDSVRDPRSYLPPAPLTDPIRGLGAADLDPLGRFGPGMIVDPRGQGTGRLPMPLPEFDPAYPGQMNPGILGRNRNEPGLERRNFGDAMRPPSFNDSMFM